MKTLMRKTAAPLAAALAWLAGLGGLVGAQETAPAHPTTAPDPVPALLPGLVMPALAANPEGDKPRDPLPDPLGYVPGLNGGTKLDLQWPVPADARSVNPDGQDAVSMEELVNNVAHNKVSINMVWVLVTGFLVMFMQAGFALVETGLCRAKHAAHVMATTFLVYPLGMLGFWVCGFAFMFGGYFNGPVAIGWQPPFGQGLQLLNGEFSVELFGKSFGLLGTKGFFLNNDFLDSSVFALFLFQMVFMDTAATIPTGAMAERWSFKNFMLYGGWVGALCYPIYGNWVWGGGWLAQLGVNFGLGHGHVDFAGSSVVHLTGGILALVGSATLGPRLGKYGSDRKPRAMRGHNVPYVLLGSFILAFGWFGFNAGSTLAGTDNHAAIIAVNTMLASAGGALGTTLWLYLTARKPDPTMICNGLLAGLVAITASCAFVSSLAAVLIGLISGVLVVLSVNFLDQVVKIDDPVGAISVHGVCGIFGTLCVGIFANGSYGAGWGGVHTLFKEGAIQTVLNDGTTEALRKYAELTTAGWMDQGVTGIFGTAFGANYNDRGQLTAAFIAVITNMLFVGISGFIWFKVSNLLFPLRSSRQDELDGLDRPEMGVEAYPDYHLSDRTSPPVQ